MLDMCLQVRTGFQYYFQIHAEIFREKKHLKMRTDERITLILMVLERSSIFNVTIVE